MQNNIVIEKRATIVGFLYLCGTRTATLLLRPSRQPLFAENKRVV